MSQLTTADDLERDIARTLRAKADQLVVGDDPFPDTAVGRVAPTRLRTPPARRRRVLAAAALVVVLAGGALIGLRRGADTDRHAAMRAPDAWLDETVAFGPGDDGWQLAGVHLTEASDADPVTWQLFGARDEVPVPRGLLVGTVHGRWSVPSQSLPFTIHGQAGTIGPPLDPSLPTGTSEAVWGVGEVWYRALAVGLTDAQMLAVLDSLVPRAGAVGFDPPADGSLALLDESATRDAGGAAATYTGADGDVIVNAVRRDAYGGLLHRLAGSPTDAGIVLVGDLGDHPSGQTSVTILRDDGWTVAVAGDAGLATDDLTDLARRARPVARREVIAWAADQPVTGRVEAGDWSVRVHGTAEADTAVCLSARSDDGEVCTTADAAVDITTASVPLGDDWLVVTLTNPPNRAIVRTAPGGSGNLGETIDGELGRGDGRLVQVTAVPEGVDAVDVGGWSSGGGAHTYRRPGAA